MGKIVKVDFRKKSKPNLLTTILRGTPYKGSFGNKKVQVVGVLYRFKKQKEFYNNYWQQFTKSFGEVHHSQEFNPKQTVQRFYSLSELKQFSVIRECENIYIFEDKVNYAQFIDLVDKEYINEKSDLKNSIRIV